MSGWLGKGKEYPGISPSTGSGYIQEYKVGFLDDWCGGRLSHNP